MGKCEIKAKIGYNRFSKNSLLDFIKEKQTERAKYHDEKVKIERMKTENERMKLELEKQKLKFKILMMMKGGETPSTEDKSNIEQ